MKQRLIQKELTIGSWITIGSETVAELMAHQNFDWLVVDCEHSAIGLERASNLVRVIQRGGTPCFVRVGVNDANLIKRTMDMGIDGLIVPMVCSASDAERAVSAIHYPPVGQRGVGLARAQGYGLSFEEYKEWLADHSVLIVQIEHINAVRNLEAIMDTDGVDGFLIGPYDLSGSIGVPGEFDHPEMLAALTRVREISEARGYLRGCHVISPDGQALSKAIDEGYQFIAQSLDTLFFASSMKLTESLRTDSTAS